MAKKSIKINPAHKGLLHEKTGTPKGQPIPDKTLKKDAKAPGKLGEEARFAENAKKWKRK